MDSPNPTPQSPAPSVATKTSEEPKDQAPKSRLPSPESYARFLLDRHRHTS